MGIFPPSKPPTQRTCGFFLGHSPGRPGGRRRHIGHGPGFRSAGRGGAPPGRRLQRAHRQPDRQLVDPLYPLHQAAQGTLPANGLVVKSLVSTRMADAICAHYGVEIRDVLTGFRFISEQIAQCEATGQRQFLFGFEESFGFLAGTFARDKDAICAAMLLSEACVAYREENKTLYDVLQEMYKTYGYFKESVKSYTLEGKAGLEKIAAAMASLRKTPPKEFAQAAIVAYEDFKTRERRTAAGAVEPITFPSRMYCGIS